MVGSDSGSASTPEGYDVFISYKFEDLVHAETLHENLRRAGFRVWFDKARLNPGCNWHKEIEAGCDGSRVVLPVLTPGWKKSEWTKFETYGAEAVIPLCYEGSWDEVATPPLRRYQNHRMDLHEPQEADFEKLIAAIRGLLDRPAPETVARAAHMRYRANPYFVGREQALNHS